MKPLGGVHLKIIGIVTVLLLLISILIIASPWSKGNHQYKCKSCGASSNNPQTPQSEPVIKELEGQEKGNAVSRAINSEDFKLVNSILTKAGYQLTLENATVLTALKEVRGQSVQFLAAAVYFTGDRESRPVGVLVFLEPFQSASALRLDIKRNVLELLVKVADGQVRGGILVPKGYVSQGIWGDVNAYPLTAFSCPPCEIEVCHSYNLSCLAWNCIDCIGDCLIERNPLRCLWCVVWNCGFESAMECCTNWGCTPCQPEGCWTVPKCYGCPVCP